jgi:hypothetical protein
MSSFIKLFGRALPGDDYNDYKGLLELAVEKGYFVHISCNTFEVKEFLETKPSRKDFSSTFYKVWEDIKSQNRFELLCDQLLYYVTRVNPNDLLESELPTVLFENLKPILPITAEEACAKCLDMLESGIALSKDTLQCIFDVFDKCKFDKINVDKIKNREARLITFKRISVLPSESNEFLRYLVYLATDETMLITNHATLLKITKSAIDVSEKIKSFGLAKLSAIYGRYKLVLMAFKHANKTNVAVINKLTKSSKKKSLKESRKLQESAGNYFQTLLSSSEPLDGVYLSKKLVELNNFKKIALLETINMYLDISPATRVFMIRNAKTWVKSAECKSVEAKRKAKVSFPLKSKRYHTTKQPFAVKDAEKLKAIYAIIYESLVSSLKSKYLHASKKSFRLPEKCTLTAPRSEKAFVGEYPFGSSLTLEESDCVVGISWDKDDNAHDIDLSLLSMKSEKIGWNSQFKDEKSNILFSGDVVEAPGTELIYAGNGFQFDSGVFCNLYRSADADKPSSFKFFVAREKIAADKMTKNYMIDPNSVCFSTKVAMESKELILGFLTQGRFIFTTFRSNDSIVSSGNDHNAKLIEFNLALQKCHLDLRKLLLDAGFSESKLPGKTAVFESAEKSMAVAKQEQEEVFTFETKSDIISFFKN